VVTVNISSKQTLANPDSAFTTQNLNQPTSNISNIDVITNDDTFGCPVTVTIPFQPTVGTAVANPDNTISWTGPSDFVGVDTIIYQICAPPLPINCANSTVTVHVLFISEFIRATTTQVVNPPSADVTIPLLNNTVDIKSLQILIPPTNGRAEITPSGNAIYTPDFTFAGDGTFVYQICTNNSHNNNNKNCSNAQVNVRVQIIALPRYYEVQEGIPFVSQNTAQIADIDLLMGTPTQPGNLFGPSFNTPNPIRENNTWYWWDENCNSEGFDFSNALSYLPYWADSCCVCNTDGPPLVTFQSTGFLNDLTAEYTLCSPVLEGELPNCATNNVTVFVRIKAPGLPVSSLLSTRTHNATEVIDIGAWQPCPPSGQPQPDNASSITILGFLNFTLGHHAIIPTLPPAWGTLIFWPNYPKPGAGLFIASRMFPPNKAIIFWYLICANNNNLNCDNSTVSISFGAVVGSPPVCS